MIRNISNQPIKLAGRWTYNGTFNYWWNDYTDSNYTEAVQCITDFFTNQTLGPYLVDGENKTVKLEKQFHSLIQNKKCRQILYHCD